MRLYNNDTPILSTRSECNGETREWDADIVLGRWWQGVVSVGYYDYRATAPKRRWDPGKCPVTDSVFGPGRYSLHFLSRSSTTPFGVRHRWRIFPTLRLFGWARSPIRLHAAAHTVGGVFDSSSALACPTETRATVTP